MKESYEFRVTEDYADRLFGPNEGKRLGSIRKVILPSDDERLRAVGELQQELSSTAGRPFFFGWHIRREYTSDELRGAQIFTFFINAYFEPAGEECGTRFDESTACSICGAGARQTGPLILDERKIPKHADFAVTIASEPIVSRRVADTLQLAGITGFELRPVLSQRTSRQLTQWAQLVVVDNSLQVCPPTIIQNEPFPDPGSDEGRCPRGDLLGLNLISEVTVTVKTTTADPPDFAATSAFVGVRRGLLRPRRLILISPKLWGLLQMDSVKGYRVEVAHFI